MLDHKNLIGKAQKEAHKCLPMKGNFPVGCVICDPWGNIISTGYTGENNGREHAEQVAIEKALKQKISLKKATLYSTLEPCSCRKSNPISCVDRIIQAGISHVYYLEKEPTTYIQKPKGHQKLKQSGIHIEQIEI